MSNCRSCDAPIIWATTEANGKPMPLDPVPHTGGNILLVDGGKARVLSGNPDGLVLYTSHFATCPNAGQHRRSTSADA